MCRFYFDLHDGASHIDMEGTELPDVAAARVQAAKWSGRLLSDRAASFWDGDEWTMVVRDETNLVMFSLVFLGIDGASTCRKHATAA